MATPWCENAKWPMIKTRAVSRKTNKRFRGEKGEINKNSPNGDATTRERSLSENSIEPEVEVEMRTNFQEKGTQEGRIKILTRRRRDDAETFVIGKFDRNRNAKYFQRKGTHGCPVLRDANKRFCVRGEGVKNSPNGVATTRKRSSAENLIQPEVEVETRQIFK